MVKDKKARSWYDYTRPPINIGLSLSGEILKRVGNRARHTIIVEDLRDAFNYYETVLKRETKGLYTFPKVLGPVDDEDGNVAYAIVAFPKIL